jgi:hypothetical protein
MHDRLTHLSELALYAQTADDFAALSAFAPGAPAGMFARCALFLALLLVGVAVSP